MSKIIFSTFNGNHERANTMTIETSSAWVLDCFLIFSLKRLFWISSTLWSRATGRCVPVVVGFEFDNKGSWKIRYWYRLSKSNYPNNHGLLQKKFALKISKPFAEDNSNLDNFTLVIVVIGCRGVFDQQKTCLYFLLFKNSPSIRKRLLKLYKNLKNKFQQNFSPLKLYWQ